MWASCGCGSREAKFLGHVQAEPSKEHRAARLHTAERLNDNVKTADDEVLDLIKTWGDVPKILARLETNLHEHGQHVYSAYLGPIAGLRFIESCNTDELGFLDVARREGLEFTRRVTEKLGGGMFQCGGCGESIPVRGQSEADIEDAMALHLPTTAH